MSEGGDPPTVLEIVAWGWIAVGVWGLCSGAIGAVAMVQFFGDTSTELSNRPWFWMAGLGAGGVHIAGSILGVAAGWYLRDGRSWARTCLEILSWLVVVEFVATALYAVVLMAWTGLMVAAGSVALVLSALSTTPFAVAIYLLRGDEIRSFVDGTVDARVDSR